ncbi:uncharacterized protein [Primulina eburnea]|uniref:uncharacterized protein n=1 Tax=Primulina eburnea TaxID=1245227 RepID=UPI003C6BF18D
MRACERACWGIFLVCLSFAVSLCSTADEQTVAVEVVGTAECADCKTYNIKSTQAFSGLRVSVDCKLENGETKRMGDADIQKNGKFKISISHEPNQNCYVQIHSAAAVPCPSHGGLDASKIVLKSQTNGAKTFSLSTNLQFTTAPCASKTFSSYFHQPPLPPLSPHPWLKSYHSWPPLPPLSPHPWLKSYHWPPLPPLSPHPWLKGSHSLPPLSPFPPLPPLFHHKQPPAPVIYTPPVVQPLPPLPPVYTPKPSVPVYKPKPPVYKPKPSVPVYKPKPPVPVVYKPKPPVSKPAPEFKPLPPAVPSYKPPCPPLPKLPPLPKFPPKYFHHPKYGFNFPPLPPHHP